MLKIVGLVVVFLCIVLAGPIARRAVAAEAAPNLVMFYREGCTDCRHMDDLLDELQDTYPALTVQHIEEGEPGAADLMWTLASKYGIFPSAFPVIFIGNQGIVGVGKDKELLLRSTVRDCMANGCKSPLAKVNEKPFPWIAVATGLVAVLVVAILLLP